MQGGVVRHGFMDNSGAAPTGTALAGPASGRALIGDSPGGQVLVLRRRVDRVVAGFFCLRAY